MKKEKMNDKGFSLVELIIVIAIMAVLVVVLAPQYLKYVERSRNSTDISNATAIVTALQVYAADPDVETADAFKVGDTFDVSIVAAGSTPDSSVSAGAATKALDEAKITITEVHCKSKSNWTAYNIHGEVVTGGSIEFTYSSTHSGATDEFATAMTK